MAKHDLTSASFAQWIAASGSGSLMAKSPTASRRASADTHRAPRGIGTSTTSTRWKPALGAGFSARLYALPAYDGCS
jgi:hypothetical protein